MKIAVFFMSLNKETFSSIWKLSSTVMYTNLRRICTDSGKIHKENKGKKKLPVNCLIRLSKTSSQ